MSAATLLGPNLVCTDQMKDQAILKSEDKKVILTFPGIKTWGIVSSSSSSSEEERAAGEGDHSADMAAAASTVTTSGSAEGEEDIFFESSSIPVTCLNNDLITNNTYNINYCNGGRLTGQRTTEQVQLNNFS